MPCFTYAAIDASTGREQRGRIDGEDVATAIAAIKARGLHPVEVRRLNESRERPRPRAQRSGFAKRLRGSMTLRERMLFIRQLTSLVRAGLPLLRSLEVLSRQRMGRRMTHVADVLAEAIRGGVSLSEAMAQEPRNFDRMALALVQAGEAAGALAEVLDRLAGFLEKAERTRRRVRAAAAYPLFVLVVATSIVAGLTVFVIPRFREVFADVLKGQSLPPLTEAVLAIAEGLRDHAAILGGGALAVGVVAGFLLQTQVGGRLVDRCLLFLPGVAQLETRASAARFARTLGTLLGAGVPILDALAIGGAAVRNRVVAAAISGMRERVRAGGALSAAMEEAGRFPPMLTSLVQVGEETGRMPEVLQRAAEFCDEQVDQAVGTLTGLLEPAMIVTMALVVGTVVIALFLPILQIVQSLS